MWRLLFIATLLLTLSCGRSSDHQEQSIKDEFLGVMFQSAQKPGSCEWLAIFDGIKKVNLSFLWGSYGNDNSCLLELFSRSDAVVLRAYLSNGVCIRKGNCSAAERQSLVSIQAAAREFLTLANSCSHCTVQIVPQLEDNWDHGYACAVYSTLKRFGVEVIRNPVKQSQYDYDRPCYDGIELHNESPKRPGIYSGSNDGKSLLLSSYQYEGLFISRDEARRSRDALGRDSYYFLWHPVGNCLKGDTANAPFPIDRECEVRPDIYADLNQILREGL